MAIHTRTLELRTEKEAEFIDITGPVNAALKEMNTKTGIVLIQTLNTTTAIYVNEDEKYLFEDLEAHLESKAPKGNYKHDQIALRECPEDEPLNGHAHVKAALYGSPSVTLAYDKGSLTIGKWQRVLFAEYDGPCPRHNKSVRKILVRAIGE